ncbi:MFS general substrate transporter [Testicularia cyperi]|uniref:MFS general substrate transporter n=1 Tax=Testicularia cyperi TaxID=1882483 RepID=A0A317XHF2_9BASI|nr:MFS general substrate transporter [Testicularia cyperi]
MVSSLNHPDPKHPFNLPTWRKLLMLATVSLTAFAANEMAAAHLTAFHQVSLTFDRTITAVANTIGISILGLGTGPLLWNAIAESLGRRPAYLVAWTLYLPCVVWLSVATSYNSFAAARFFAGFCSSVSQTVPASIISETFLPEHRGTAVAAWTVLLIIGPVCAPIIGAGFLTVTTWRWVYYFDLILAGVLWIMIVLFVPETHYIVNPHAVTLRSHNDSSSAHDHKDKDLSDVVEGTSTPPMHSSDIESSSHATFGHVGVAWYPWKEPGRFLAEIVAPLKMAMYLPVILPSILYAVIFMWSVGFTVVSPQVFPRPPWNFTNVAVGASFIAAAVGALFGKFAGGWVADATVTWFVKRNGGDGKRVPEYRLWSMLPHIFIFPLGLLLYGIGYARGMSWPTEVIGGFGLYYVSNSAAGGILQTYIIESYITKAVHGIALFNFVKCCMAFSAPFFIPEWAFEDFTKSYVVQAIVTAALTIAVVAFLILFGGRLRKAQKMVSAS